MFMSRASSPSKAILFGEHAVVYGKLGVAAAVDRRINVTVEPGAGGAEFDTFKADRSELQKALKDYRAARAAGDINTLKAMGYRGANMVTLAEAMDRWGWADVKVHKNMNEPVKGLGGSAAIFAALAHATAALLGKQPSAEEISSIAYAGDCVMHGGTPSGIDNSTVAHGGYISYRKGEVPKRLDITFTAPLVVVLSGEAASTAEMVTKVRQLREQQTSFVDGIMAEIESTARAGLDALKAGDIEKIGSLMYANHELLRKLGVSTAKLDVIVELARKEGAPGAKLTGAGGGGCAIVLARDDEQANKLVGSYARAGFKAFTAQMGAQGVRLED
jgi:mevalonate kinase